MQLIEQKQRLLEGAEHLRKLPVEQTVAFLCDLADRIGGTPAIIGTLNEYRRIPVTRHRHAKAAKSRRAAV